MRFTPLLAIALTSLAFASLALTSLGLSGCTASAPVKSPAELAAQAAAMTPSDPRLAGLYASACKACHAVAGSGAPLAGDATAWRPRLAKGMPALMQSVVSGFNGMPAGGQCFSCTADDYRALISFMSTAPTR